MTTKQHGQLQRQEDPKVTNMKLANYKTERFNKLKVINEKFVEGLKRNDTKRSEFHS